MLIELIPLFLVSCSAPTVNNETITNLNFQQDEKSETRNRNSDNTRCKHCKDKTWNFKAVKSKIIKAKKSFIKQKMLVKKLFIKIRRLEREIKMLKKHQMKNSHKSQKHFKFKHHRH